LPTAAGQDAPGFTTTELPIVARLPRFILPGQPQHLIQRGNNREAIFFAEADYRVCLEKLKEA